MKITTKTINYSVDTIEQLLLTDGVDNDTIIVTDENRGGVFVFRDENSQINNGGTIFNGWTRLFGDIYTKSPNGTLYKIYVADGGTLVVTSV